MGKIHLEIVTPENVLVNQDVDMVIAPGILGEFGVLVGHAHLLSVIEPGELRFTVDGNVEHLAVTDGFAEVSNDTVSVLVDAAERARDIDLIRAQQAMERAKERLAMDRGSQDVDFTRAEAAMKRAIMRIKVAEKTDM